MHSYLGLTILCIDVIDDEIVRVIVVFCPLCNMLFSKAGVKVRFHKLKSSRDTAKTARWLQCFFAKLRIKNASAFTDSGFDLPVSDNILHLFYTHVHNTQFIHWGLKQSILSIRQYSTGEAENVYGSDYTNMLKKSNSDPRVIGRKSRPEYGSTETVDETNDSGSDDEESVVSLDEDNEALWDVSDDVDQREKKKQKKKHENMFQRGILSRIFTAEPDVDDETFVERHIKRAVEFMRHDQEGKLLSPGVVSKRFEYVCKSGLLSGETLILFKEEYLRNRNNSGNTTAHNAPTNFEIEAVN